jgi:hypothetical protein
VLQSTVQTVIEKPAKKKTTKKKKPKTSVRPFQTGQMAVNVMTVAQPPTPPTGHPQDPYSFPESPQANSSSTGNSQVVFFPLCVLFIDLVSIFFVVCWL